MSIRRISRTRVPVASVGGGSTKKQMQETLQSIAKMQATIEQLQKNILPLSAKLLDDMKKAKLDSLESDAAYADITRSAGKSQVTIDPKKFQKKVGDDDFYACCTIGVTKAKTILGQKEIDKISTTVSGKTGEPVLKVKLKV